MSTKAWILVSLAGLSLIPQIRHPVVKAAKKSAQVVSQPFRHPVKDAKKVAHFVKGS